MAKIRINGKHKKSDGYGFNLIDSKRNILIYYYNKPFLQVTDEVAERFEHIDCIDIEYDDQSRNKKKPVIKKLDYATIKAMNRNEQVQKIRKLKFTGTIPRYEKQRIELILHLLG